MNDKDNSILGNSIYANGGLGIDLGDDGVTPNNPAGSVDGPNHLKLLPRAHLGGPEPERAGDLGDARRLGFQVVHRRVLREPCRRPLGLRPGADIHRLDSRDHRHHRPCRVHLRCSLRASPASTSPPRRPTRRATPPSSPGTSSPSSRRRPNWPSLPGPVFIGLPITLVAITVGAAQAPGRPAGEVDFTEDGLPVGSANLDPSGVGSLTIPGPGGSHTFAAAFLGSATDFGSASNQFVVTAVKQATTTTLQRARPRRGLRPGPHPHRRRDVRPRVTPSGVVDFTEDGQPIGSATPGRLRLGLAGRSPRPDGLRIPSRPPSSGPGHRGRLGVEPHRDRNQAGDDHHARGARPRWRRWANRSPSPLRSHQASRGGLLVLLRDPWSPARRNSGELLGSGDVFHVRALARQRRDRGLLRRRCHQRSQPL